MFFTNLRIGSVMRLPFFRSVKNNCKILLIIVCSIQNKSYLYIR